MNIGNRRRSRDEFDRLLAGDLAHAGRLGEALAGATAPARDGELSGVTAAIAAFVAAGAGAPAPVTSTPGRRSMIKTLLASTLATKIVAGFATAAVIGGVSLAASTGHLPGQGPGHPPAHPVVNTLVTPTGSATPTPTGSSTALADPDTTAAPTGNATPTPTPSPSPTVTPSATDSGASLVPSPADSGASPVPSPAALTGLCRAWQAHEHNPANPGKWRRSTAFARLITAAGGPDSVDGFCAVVAGSTTPTPTTTAGSPIGPQPGDTTHGHHGPTARHGHGPSVTPGPTDTHTPPNTLGHERHSLTNPTRSAHPGSHRPANR